MDMYMSVSPIAGADLWVPLQLAPIPADGRHGWRAHIARRWPCFVLIPLRRRHLYHDHEGDHTVLAAAVQRCAGHGEGPA